ncbi:translation initiation factor eIF2B subunit delta-like [Clavelina lepadiformis]|uniref:translation initiation factor eIF2B subunit delta-like n=1 Tax=Clavelina lepadiformis TaxID=159417 RepID=UPI004042AAA6
MQSADVGDPSKANKAVKKSVKKERRKEKISNKGDSSKSQQQQSVQQFDGAVAPKSKAELRAERRAKQEAERAAKTLKKEEQAKSNKAKGPQVSANLQVDDPKVQKKAAKKLEKQQVPQRTEGHKKVTLFSHLHQYERSVSITKDIGFGSTGIHPAIIKLGLQYAEGIITGSNARCAALMNAVCHLIADYETPPQKELARHLESKLKPAISFLNQCRPLSVSMGSAIKYMKIKITKIPSDMSDDKAKQELISDLQAFVHVNITLAKQAISNSACSKISDGDVVMIYGSSSLIIHVLNAAFKTGRNFRVVVVDGRPKLSGIRALRHLCRAGIKCSYVLISAVSYIMPEVTKVFLGAHGLLSNGYVMGSVGTSLVSMAAKARGVPVIVCCEAYKFCERVQTDSFVNNEIGDPRDLLATDGSSSGPLIKEDAYKNLDSLKVLYLTYDVTPPQYMAMVVTELGMLPCTSVPVVLRVRSFDT